MDNRQVRDAASGDSLFGSPLAASHAPLRTP